jgi:gluconokinase
MSLVPDEGQRLIVMGVSGCGKSSVAQGLAQAIGGRFFDGDDFHPVANIAKMSLGQPLDDNDRWPWLTLVGEDLGRGERMTVGACSALKRRYRDHITKAAGGRVLFLHLAGSRELIAERMVVREGHFMPPALLDSQFAALEPPAEDEHAITIDIRPTILEIVTAAVAALEARQ